MFYSSKKQHMRNCTQRYTHQNAVLTIFIKLVFSCNWRKTVEIT